MCNLRYVVLQFIASLKWIICEVLELLVADPFAPSLKAHKLKGELESLWACWVEYDCRIVFTLGQDTDSDEELIVLIDIGTHDEVY
jgi:addiction module RelE/StbE family toxin